MLENIFLADQEDWVVKELTAKKIYTAKSMYRTYENFVEALHSLKKNRVFRTEKMYRQWVLLCFGDVAYS